MASKPVIVSHDLDYYFPGTLKELVSLPLIWREFFVGDGLGEFTIPTLWAWPVIFITAYLNWLGLDFSLIIKILFIPTILLLSFISIKKLTYFYGISGWSQTISILFYLTNTYIILLVDGGQLGLALAYGLFPLTFLSFKKCLNASTSANIINAAIFTIALSFFDMRIIFLLALLLFLDLLFETIIKKQPQKILNYLKAALLATMFLIGVHFFWLLPSLYSRLPELPIGYNRATQVNFLSFATITHSLYSLQPHWYENVFGQIRPVKAEFALIPILVFISAILKRKDVNVAFWLTTAIISIFLTKGSNEPLPQIYKWAFENILGFSFFRDPTKFFFLLALSYSVLLGTSSSAILQKLAYFPKIRFIFITFCIAYLLFLSRPIWLDQMTGLFAEPIYQREYFQLASLLSKEESFSRILWIPKKPSLGFVSSNHPSLDAIRLSQKRPFAVGTVGTYETLNFLREAAYMGELLDVSGVGFITDPYLNPRRDDMHPDNIRYYYTFLNQLSKRPWVLGFDNQAFLPLLKVKQHQDRFFLTPDLWWVIGSDSIYNQLTKVDNLKLSKNALVFAEEYPGLSNRLDDFPYAKIILNNKNLLDLAASFIEPAHLIFPAKQLDFEPNRSGWWKREGNDLINWRDFLQTKYGIDNQDFDLGGGWAVGEKSLKLKVQSEKLVKEKVLLARAMESSRSGILRFYQDNHVIGQIYTKTQERANMRWFEIGNLKISSRSLTIESEGDVNVVNVLAVVDPKRWLVYKEKSQNLRKNDRIMSLENVDIEQFGAKVDYQQINSTKYKVRISNLKKPEFLVFSENYDSLWRLDDQMALPVFSLLNGFKVEKDGEYIVEFSAQKYVFPGFVISVLTIFVIASGMILSKRKRRN